MGHTNPTASRRLTPANDVIRAAVVRQQRADFGALVLDGQGVVVSCSDAGVRMFGGDLGDLEGCTIWSLLTNITPSDTSPGFSAGYMACLSQEAKWHQFQAVDVYGQRFPVEIALSKMKVENNDMFLLNLRHPVE